MAKVKREFLVPYLQDICALYMAQRKLERQYEGVKERIGDLYGGRIAPPKKVMYEADSGACAILNIIGGILTFCAILTAYMVGEIWWATIFFGIFGIPMLIFSMVWTYRDKRSVKILNEEAQRQYEADMRKYEQYNADLEERRKKIPELKQLQRQYSLQWQEAEKLIEKAYSVNIIPHQYRDVYTIVYLYDYFSGSRECDLALALNTFVLEQIKDRLDRIIDRQSEMILNQYRIIGNQEKAMAQAERHQIEMRNSLRQIAASNEERNMYLKMIQSNTATLQYFATVDYLIN